MPTFGRLLMVQMAVLVAIAPAFHPHTAQAQSNDGAWWEEHPYYNEDEWYDPTDWFDSNNYEFDREAWEQDQQNGPDSRRQSRGDWHVSKTDESLAYYRDSDQDGIYEQSYRYFDFDGDHEFEAYMALFDRDDSGDYEEMDFISFAPIDWRDRARAEFQASDDSRRHRFTGELREMRVASVGGRRHVVATVENEEGRQRVVDLGQEAALNNLDLRPGDQVTVQGPAARVDRQLVILADEVRSNGRIQEVLRPSQQARGTLVSLGYANARGVQHAMGVVESDGGRRTRIDFGPAKHLTELEFRPGQYLSATGPILKVDGQRVLMAQIVRHRNTTAKIDRDLRDEIALSNGSSDGDLR